VLYVDTSVLVALCVPEPKSASVSAWYAACAERLSSAIWCVTEFANALAIKERTRQLTKVEARTCFATFERLCERDLELLPVEPKHFLEAATLTQLAASGLRAGDALHLAVALGAQCKAIATLDAVLAANAKRLKLKLVSL
jgi:uncharacterized protein